jgi:hypothetical protein
MPDANAHAPDMRPSIRKAHRDDPVRNALANFCENLDGAQWLLAAGSKGSAKDCVNNAVSDLTAVLSGPGIRDLIVEVNALGRIEAFLDYSDDLGDIRLTYTARQPLATDGR